MDKLLAEIEGFASQHGMSDAAFGEASLNDRHLVRQLRAGRELRSATLARVRKFMAEYRPAQVAA